MGSRSSVRQNRSHQRLLADSDMDPLSGMANLFDAGMVFAAAMMVLLLMQKSPANGQAKAPDDLTPDALTVDRFRPSDATLEGSGERLGTAYRLATGEIVYVPDPAEE